MGKNWYPSFVESSLFLGSSWKNNTLSKLSKVIISEHFNSASILLRAEYLRIIDTLPSFILFLCVCVEELNFGVNEQTFSLCFHFLNCAELSDGVCPCVQGALSVEYKPPPYPALARSLPNFCPDFWNWVCSYISSYSDTLTFSLLLPRGTLKRKSTV